MLGVDLIDPISDSRWVSPLVIVPKKGGKWKICVDYKELNKETKKDYFPLPSVYQALENLAGKKYFSFLDGYSGYNQISIALEDQDKITFTCPCGTFVHIFPCHLAYVMPLQRSNHLWSEFLLIYHMIVWKYTWMI